MMQSSEHTVGEPMIVAPAPASLGAQSRRTRKAHHRVALAVLFGIGLVANLALLSLFYRPAWKSLVGDERFYVPRIRAYAAGETVQWDPLWPPLYIDVMGGLSRLAGAWHPAVGHATQLALFFGAAWLFYLIARRLLVAPGAALAATAFFLLMPDLAAYTGFFLAEVLHLFLALGALWLLLAHGDRIAALAASGALTGLALAGKLLLLPFVPVLLVAAAWRHPGSWPRRVGAAAVMGAAMLLIMLPFMLRNERLHGVFMIADSSLLNRLIALEDRAPRDWLGATTIRGTLDEFQSSAATHRQRKAIARARLDARLVEKGLLATYLELAPKQYQRLLHHDTYLTTQLPGGPRAAFALRDGPLATAIRVWAHSAYALLLVAAAIGLAAVRWTRARGLLVALLFLFYNSAVFLVVITQTRYMVPIYPALMLFAGAASYALAQRLRGVPAGTPGFAFTPVRVVLGVAGALALLAVAFPEAWSGA